MKKYLTIVASFGIMMCIGSVYAWSIVAAELIENYGFSVAQSQIIFGALIAMFPITMIFVGQLSKRTKHSLFGYVSGVFFFLGYILAGFSEGNFVVIFLGVGVLGGVATGMGYWVSLTLPVQWFPEKKGLVTGIASAGFGLGALFMSEIAEIFFVRGYDVLFVLKFFGIAYGLIIMVSSIFLYQTKKEKVNVVESVKISQFIKTSYFKKLTTGIFLGSFAGLLIIGSLKIIGSQYEIAKHILVMGVAFFAIANFLGRLAWGYLSDIWSGSLNIFLALLFQSLSILMLNVLDHSEASYLIVASLIGFGFGGNFVLFAKETAQVYGVKNLGVVYPYVFIGYALAGISGPISGGLLYDATNSYFYAIVLASFMSLMGSVLFLFEYVREKNERFK